MEWFLYDRELHIMEGLISFPNTLMKIYFFHRGIPVKFFLIIIL